MSILASLFFVASVVSVAPAHVPAHGKQNVTLTVPQAGMVHLDISGTTGARCEVVDHLRGPFASAGSVGHQKCALDLLLDEGTYRVRLQAPKTGKGTLTAKAKQFSEMNSPVPSLEPGDSSDLHIRAGDQASYWVRVPTRQFVALRVAGRTVGQVELWRDGKWREESGGYDSEPFPLPGQGIHEWWITRIFEAGDYLLTAYGVNEKKWTQGVEPDAVTIARGFPDGSEGHNETFVLPESGLVGFDIGKNSVSGILSLAAGLNTETKMELFTLGADDSVDFRQPTTACTIAPRARNPTCAASTAAKTRHILIVRGAPGTSGRLQWTFFNNDESGDGTFGIGNYVEFRVAKSGRYLVGASDLPMDTDAPPLSCSLSHLMPNSPESEIASDMLEVGSQKPFQRSFNFSGHTDSVQFRVGAGATFHITTTGDHAQRCAVLPAANGSKLLMESDPEAKKCDLNISLGPGDYRLDLYGSAPGVEKLRIAAPGAPDADTPAKAGCTIPDVALYEGNRYRLNLSRQGDVAARTLVLRAGPMPLENPLPLTLDVGKFVRLPIAAGQPVEVYTWGGSVGCAVSSDAKAESVDGVCRAPGSETGGTLVITPKGNDPIQVVVARAPPVRSAKKLTAYSPKPLEPPVLPIAKPMFFDFDRDESHSLVFDVTEAGLYDVTTEGLLATQCTLRTAVVTSLGSDSSGGRGRNCLLEQYLQPGRYLVTAQTTGQSRGRASVVLKRRPPHTELPVSGEGDAFFRVDAGELVSQQITVPKSAEYTLSTADRGVANQCRLEDSDGWPLVPVPASCTEKLELTKGSYIWTQLPLTVETMRHTKLERVRPHEVFKGKKVHPVAFNDWSDALLRKSGKDEFFFNLQADADVTVALTNRMQGRLYLINPDKSLKPIDVIPPAEVEAPAPAAPADQSEYGEQPANDGESDESATPPPAEGEGDEGDIGDQGGMEGEEQQAPQPQAPSSPLPATPAPAPGMPAGHITHLEAGPYKLITEHSQGDVAIRYRLFVGTDTLIPGVSRTLIAPTYLTLRVPTDGTVRLTTTGETDVRCRIFDANGVLVAESDHNGEDWNCALAQPFAKGDYKLIIESETLAAGETKITASMPPATDAGTLANGAKIKIDSGIVTGLIPALTADSVQEIAFDGGAPFSCVLLSPEGAVIDRQLDTTNCTFILRPKSPGYRAQLWTLSRSAQVTAKIGPKIPKREDIRSAGQYETDENAYCLPERERGVFRHCGGSVSLESQLYLFVGSGKSPRETLVTSDEPAEQTARVTPLPFIQRHVVSARAIHLLRVSVPSGEKNAPACGIFPGASSLGPNDCIAASQAEESAIERWWSPTEVGFEAKVLRAAAILPDKSEPLSIGKRSIALTGHSEILSVGQRSVKWTGRTARYSLPDQSHRIDLTLPADGWAIRLEPNGAVGDLCAAGPAPARCLIGGRAGELVLYAPNDSQVDVTALLSSQPVAIPTLLTVAEELLPEPTSLRYAIPSAHAARMIRVEGAAHCLLIRSDGTRTAGCAVPLAENIGAELRIEADAGAVRASIGSPDDAELARFGSPAPHDSAEWLPWSKTAALMGGFVRRGFTVDRESIVHIHADSGVCAIASSGAILQASGFGAACELHRLLAPGAYQLLIRPFGRLALTGVASWTTDPVEPLADGVGPEHQIAAGQARLFRFLTASAGKVGVGLQVPAETLDCSVLDASQHVIGTGCQQYLSLDAGSYVLAVRAPSTAAPTTFRPVIVGLAGAAMNVPEDYLRDFFKRIGEAQ